MRAGCVILHLMVLAARCFTEAAAAPPPELATSGGGSSRLDVWLNRDTLRTVFDWMRFLVTDKPLLVLVERCKPIANSSQHRALTAPKYPLISDGVLLARPQLDSLSQAGIALAHNIDSLAFGWSAAASAAGSPESLVRYRFLRLKSHNLTVLKEPTLNIPTQGYVPDAPSSFQLMLQCSNRISGITAFEVHVVFDWPQNPGRRLVVLQRHFKKACLSEEDLKYHQQKCLCRSLCNTWKRRHRRLMRQQRRQRVRLRHGRSRRRPGRSSRSSSSGGGGSGGSGFLGKFRNFRHCKRHCRRQCRKNAASCSSGATGGLPAIRSAILGLLLH